MASGSRGDKGKAPMVEQAPIGIEEGELLDVYPPLPEASVRPGKRKKHGRPEEGPLALTLLPPTTKEKQAENARKKTEKDERYRQNSVFKHRWFVWFTQETNNQTPLEQKFFTPGSIRGIQNFRSHLMELAIERFLEEKEKPDVRPWETTVSAMSQRLAKFLEEVPQNWLKHYEDWLRSREFEAWTQGATQIKPRIFRQPGATMRNDEEKQKWRRTAEMWTQWFQPPKFIKDHACTSAKYKSCESMSDNVIRWISGKETFTRMDETTRLGTGRAGLTHRVGVIDEELAQVLGCHEVVHYALKVMLRPRGDTKVHEKCIREMMAFPESHPAIIRPIGLCKDKKRPMLLFPLWNGGTLQKYMNLEKRSRGVISPEGVRLINEDFRAVVTADEWLNIQIFRKHRLQIAGTMVTGLKFMHLHKWLREYNRSMYMRGLHIPDAAEAHARMLKDIIDRMTWKKIAPPYRNYRRSMDYWAHYFNEQLYIDPTTCARPIERGPRAKVHPDGPQRSYIQIAGTMVAGLKFMHLHKWLHCDIHWQNVLLYFPSWDWDETKVRADSGRDNENKPLWPVIRRSLVFVGIGDLGKAQSFEEVQNDFDPYPTDDPNPWPWIAPELHPTLAKKLDQQNAYMTKYSEESDIFALGWLIRELCGDFFTDMTNEEKREYNRSMYMRGLHIPDAAEAHARMLKDIIDRMTWKKIAPPYRNYRRSMDYWAHYFNEQLYIDPTTCARPIERGPRAKVHPDGPQRVSRG
ncbi:hypothetical protein R1sor_001365 [Riccia sorocarpa]|uniref:Protein kinase domain-containing protein n=1 Tax=Riccia sorocarpa TaxID=122646 RepID=A0ABD3GVT0_9MARC